MVCVLYKNGVEVNRIVADADFAETYAEQNGYTYTMEPEPEPEPIPEPEPSETERLRADVDFLAAMTGVSL